MKQTLVGVSYSQPFKVAREENGSWAHKRRSAMNFQRVSRTIGGVTVLGDAIGVLVGIKFWRLSNCDIFLSKRHHMLL